MPSRQRDRGFTLLEVLIAVALIGLATTSLLGLHARSLSLVSETQDRLRAGMLASVVMSTARVAQTLDLGEVRGEFTADRDQADGVERLYGGEDGEGFIWERRVETNELGLEEVRYVTVIVRREIRGEVLAELWSAVRRSRL